MSEFDLIRFGKIPVPWTVSWSVEREGKHFVAIDPVHGMPAVFAPEARGQGKPLFAKPHDQRLRRAMREQRCDLCGMRFRPGETKISLSNPQATDLGDLQVEPMVHRACGIVSLANCPMLQARAKSGIMMVRQIQALTLATSFLTSEAVMEITGEDWPDGAVMGALKYRIDRSIRRDVDWLLRKVS